MTRLLGGLLNGLLAAALLATVTGACGKYGAPRRPPPRVELPDTSATEELERQRASDDEQHDGGAPTEPES